MSHLVMNAIRHLDPIRVENPAHPGTPDINFCGPNWVPFLPPIEGWIELKEIASWPCRASTIVRMEHFTNQQRIWLERRWRHSGAAWLLVKVDQTWLLFSGETGARVAGRVVREELEAAATKVWRNSAEMKAEIARCLSR